MTPSLEVCDDSHEAIYFVGDSCPLCSVIDDLSSLEDRISSLIDELEQLKDELDQAKNITPWERDTSIK